MNDATQEPAPDANPTGKPAAGATGELAQYLTFVLAGEEYGVEILRVQEIKGWEGVTRVPHTAGYMLGVMNLRGTVVPVVCLRGRFGLPPVEFGPNTVVIVVRVHAGRREKTVGMVVDGVSDVFNVAPADIRPPPEINGVREAGLISGLASSDAKMIMLLDIDRLIASSLEADLAVPPLH